MKNIPVVKVGVVAVSRDCFPQSLSKSRQAAVLEQCRAQNVNAVGIDCIVENEIDAAAALKELQDKQCNALCIFLGNFGPETPETLIAQNFGGPVMCAAAAEESGSTLIDGRGDAYCGMLNFSYNMGLRNIKAYIPEYPVGTADEVAGMIGDFVPVARILLGIKSLKIFAFGPRPMDFLACNAPIKPLYNLGVEIQENSELDLFASYNAHAGDSRIAGLTAEMAAELGAANKMPGILERLAQYELTLTDWMDKNMGMSSYAAFANKCWPAFQTEFKFVPCYVNSRFSSNLIPIACETDIFGALSEYIIACATEVPPTLLDINNSVPADLYKEGIAGKFDYSAKDVFMAFHCGNTPICHMTEPQMKHQLIMKRCLEPDSEPDITRGTLEGDIKPGEITFFRLQTSADCQLKSYVAEGEILPVRTGSFGAIGIFAIPEMGRFYRHVLVEKQYPHHGGVAFGKAGKAIYSALKLLGIEDIAYNQPKSLPYPAENPF